MRSAPSCGLIVDDAAAGAQDAEQRADVRRPVAQHDADRRARRAVTSAGDRVGGRRQLAPGGPAPSNSSAGAAGSSASDLRRGAPAMLRDAVVGPSRILGVVGGDRRARSTSAMPIGLPRRVYMSPCSMAARYGLVERLPDRAHRALGRDRGLTTRCRRRARGRGPRASARSTTSVTRPIRSAVSARHRSSLPISAMRSVSPRPMRRIRPIGSSAETMPVGDVRVEERGVVGADDDVGLVDEVEGARRAHALHRAHHRLPALLPLGAEQLAGVVVVPDVVGLPEGLAGRRARRRTRGRRRRAARPR